MQDKVTKDLYDSARQFARYGLTLAQAAVGYAAEVLKDVEHELRVSAEKLGRDTAVPDEHAKPPQ
jgi:hypothetical protein